MSVEAGQRVACGLVQRTECSCCKEPHTELHYRELPSPCNVGRDVTELHEHVLLYVHSPADLNSTRSSMHETTPHAPVRANSKFDQLNLLDLAHPCVCASVSPWAWRGKVTRFQLEPVRVISREGRIVRRRLSPGYDLGR